MHFKRPPTSASEIASQILVLARRDAKSVDPLKLQKILYYCQASALVEHGEPLFAESIEAWSWGPVVDKVYQEYKPFGKKPIDTTDVEQPTLSSDEIDLIESVWLLYRDVSSIELSNQTHNEDPWINARGGLAPTDRSAQPIRLEDIKTYFDERLKKANDRLSTLYNDIPMLE